MEWYHTLSNNSYNNIILNYTSDAYDNLNDQIDVFIW